MILDPLCLQTLIDESTREVCDGFKVPTLTELGPLILLGHRSKGQLPSTVLTRSGSCQWLFPGTPTREGGPSLGFSSDPGDSFLQCSGNLPLSHLISPPNAPQTFPTPWWTNISSPQPCFRPSHRPLTDMGIKATLIRTPKAFPALSFTASPAASFQSPPTHTHTEAWEHSAMRGSQHTPRSHHLFASFMFCCAFYFQLYIYIYHVMKCFSYVFITMKFIAS